MIERMREESPVNRIRILIVDDEAGARESLELILEDQYEVVMAEDGLQAMGMIRRSSFDLVLLDITMPKVNGIEILKRIKEYDDSIEVIMVSAADRAKEATASMKSGACDYITKPYEPDDVLGLVDRVAKNRCLENRTRRCHSETAFRFGDSQIVGRSERMQSVFQTIEKVAPTSSSVLVTGESGTGKELVAQAIHAKSDRAHNPFVSINCAAIPPELVESELLGHEKGAFTGAHARKIGKFEFADGGSIFLDEISSLKLELQAKLLRILQEREFSRLGSNRTVRVDVRVIAATNTRLEELVNAGQFRSDLYFRLNVIPLELPPLRKRQGDIPLLSNHFLRKFNALMNKAIKGISREAMQVLESYPWPGNVRELENLIERLVVLAPENRWIGEKDLPFDLLIRDESNELALQKQDSDMGLMQARQAFERQYILRALQRCRWNQTETAKALKIHRNTLLQKIKSLNLRDHID